MRFISWNVNGIRAVLKKDFREIFHTFSADVFALQETKCQAGQVNLEIPGYESYWSYAQKKGYSGTAVFTRHHPLQVVHELGVESLDTEGRIVALEFPAFWFVCVYTPNAQSELARIEHRMNWDNAFRTFCKNLEAGVVPVGVNAHNTTPKPLVMCGDFNVAHQEIDLKNPDTNHGNPGFSDEERAKFTELLDAGFIDTFRFVHGDIPEQYSWWSYRMRARERNVGWRIDYFLASQSLASAISGASIYNNVTGSDHCPVGVDIDIP